MANSVGQPMNRVDGRLKVTGNATYAAEHKIPNVAQAVMITSTIAKGRITSMDTREAERLPGVLAIMTPFNTAKLPTPKQSGPGGPTDRKLQLLTRRQRVLRQSAHRRGSCGDAGERYEKLLAG
jgi:xanthine dehydrogenase YagR molybdenum-binding subunit